MNERKNEILVELQQALLEEVGPTLHVAAEPLQGSGLNKPFPG